MFTKEEVEYLKSQALGRIGTASKTGRPDVAPVSFDTDGEYIYVSGRDLTNSMKYKNVIENPRASFVVDDLKTMRPWAPRQIKIQWKADIVNTQATWDQEHTSESNQSSNEAGACSNKRLARIK